jgi:hypothetical protein
VQFCECICISIQFNSFSDVIRYLVEKLSARDIDIDYNPELQEMKYMMSTVIGKKFDSDKCPEGFTRDELHLHCRGKFHITASVTLYNETNNLVSPLKKSKCY